MLQTEHLFKLNADALVDLNQCRLPDDTFFCIVREFSPINSLIKMLNVAPSYGKTKTHLYIQIVMFNHPVNWAEVDLLACWIAEDIHADSAARFG